MLVESFSHGHFDKIDSIFGSKHLNTRFSSPNLFEKNAFFQLKKESLEFFREICIRTKPIKWNEACEESNTKVLAIFLERKVLSLVGIVENGTREA